MHLLRHCIFCSPSCFLVVILITFGSVVSTSEALFQLRWSLRSTPTTFPRRSFQKHHHHHALLFPTNVVNSVATTSRETKVLCAKSSKGNDDNDDDDDQLRGDVGMAQAFRDLDALTSLLGNSEKQNQENKPTAEPRKIPVVVKIVDPTTITIPNNNNTVVTPEEEVKLYAQMVQELEENNEDDLYSNVLTEMGGTINPFDLTTTTTTTTTTSTTTSTTISTTASSLTDDATLPLPIDEEAWMNRALQEALEEAKKTSSSSTADFYQENVLNDQQLMKEIVQVFDQAHEKLMASLEEVRNDQAQWTADQNSSSLEDSKVEQDYRESAERLTQAESTLSTLLNKVQRETQSVEDAVQELERAQQQLDDNFLVRLREGGIIKQASLVGALLFALRAIGYVVATDVSSLDASSLPAGLAWQVGLAVVFAIVYILV